MIMQLNLAAFDRLAVTLPPAEGPAHRISEILPLVIARYGLAEEPREPLCSRETGQAAKA